jgi:hypothetical protein
LRVRKQRQGEEKERTDGLDSHIRIHGLPIQDEDVRNQLIPREAAVAIGEPLESGLPCLPL